MTDDLISRLSELRCQYNCFDENERDAYHTLSEAIKAISAQRTGRWIFETLDGTPGYRPTVMFCSKCGRVSIANYSYCPNCGARMEVKE